MRILYVVLLTAAFMLHCAPKPTEKIDLSKTRSSFQLTDGSSISDPTADDYSPVLVRKPDGTVILVFSSNRACGGCTGGAYHIFIAESTDAIYYDGFEVVMPAFFDPVVVTSMAAELIVDARSNLSATWSADQLLVYARTGGVIQQVPIDAPSIYLGAGNILVPTGNSAHNSATLIAFNHKEFKAITWEAGGVYEADFFSPVLGSSIDNDHFYYGDSAAQVPSAFTGFLDSYFIADGGRLYVGTAADDYGEHEEFNASLDDADLYLSTISVHSSMFHSSDVVVFSAGEGGAGAQHDLYLVTSHDASILWGMTFVYGGDFQFNPGPYRVFVSAAATTGDMNPFGGIAGADLLCYMDTNKPDINVFYSAMVVDGISRKASQTANIGDGQIDWVLTPGETYIRAINGAILETVPANGLFTFGWATGIGGSATAVRTGLNTNWTTGTHCTNWTDGITAATGSRGTANAVTSTAIGGATLACNTTGALYCVEQP